MLLAKSLDQGGDTLLEHTKYNLMGSKFISKNKKFELNELHKESIRLAAIYHDFGKANKRFQEKLQQIDKKSKELLRHEAISFIYMVELLKKHKNDEYYYASLAILNHHNRYMMINHIDVDNSGKINLQNFITKSFSSLSEYKNEKENINDSLFIGRPENGIDVSKINLPLKEVIDIYSKIDESCDTKLMSEVINKLNINNNAQNVYWFIDSLKHIYKLHFNIRKENKESSLLKFKNYILIKSLFKVCDEFASFVKEKSKGNNINERLFNDIFNSFINDTIFIEDGFSLEAKKVISGEWTPRGFQQEILESNFTNNITVLNAGVGMGKTIASELIKYKMGKKFISFHTPNRLLALNQLSKEWNNSEDLVSTNKIRNIKNMFINFHTIDQLYLSLIGSKREYLFLKLYYGGCAVLDEIDIFQDSESIKNIYTILELLKVMNIKTIITTATFTNPLKKILELVNEVEILPRRESDENKKRATFKTLNNDDIFKKIKELKENNKTIGIYCNTVNSCVLLKMQLDNMGIDSILYHSRLEEGIKDKRRNELIDSFSRDGSRKHMIAIMSPITEVGIDISFEMMISEPAPVRNIEQRAGRANRFLTFNDTIFYLLEKPLIGMYDKKYQPYHEKIAQFDPYFLNIPFLLNKHISFYKKIDGTEIGSSNMIQSSYSQKEKDEWFAGIINQDREKFIIEESKFIENFKLNPSEIFALPLFKFSIDIMSIESSLIPCCFRNVDSSSYQEYTSISNNMFEYGSSHQKLKKQYYESPDYGIFDSKILSKIKQ